MKKILICLCILTVTIVSAQPPHAKAWGKRAQGKDWNNNWENRYKHHDDDYDDRRDRREVRRYPERVYRPNVRYRSGYPVIVQRPRQRNGVHVDVNARF